MRCVCANRWSSEVGACPICGGERNENGVETMTEVHENLVVLKEGHEECPVKVTPKEWRAAAEQLAGIESELEAASEWAVTVKQQLKAKKAEIEARRSHLASIVNTSMDLRPIPVTYWAAPDTNEVLTVRQDTNEEVARRPAMPDELQAQMFEDADGTSNEALDDLAANSNATADEDDERGEVADD